jgi:hypothetical protein
MRRAFWIAMAVVGAREVADAQPAENKAAAEAAFEAGRQLAAAGNYADACPKFEASQHLDPAPGTELNLADCYEKTGRFASAWGMFQQAADDESRAGDADAEKLARDRAAALAPKLSRLTIQLPKDAIVGLVVTRNGAAVDGALLGTAMPVDSGNEHIVCTAPGRKTWSQDVSIQVGDALVVAVPNLPIDSTVAPGPAGAGDLQITVAESTEHYEIQLSTASGVLRCEGTVTRDHPCALKPPRGPAVLSVRGSATLTEDLDLAGKPVLVSVDKDSRYLLYGGMITAGAGVVALGIGLYGCSQASSSDFQNNNATGLTCEVGASVGGIAVLAGGAMMLWDVFSEHHSITTHGSDDDNDTTASRLFAVPTAHGAVLGMGGRF